MAKVYGGIEGIDNPQRIAFDRTDRSTPIDWKKLDADIEKYIEDVKAYCKKTNPNDEFAGEEYEISMADGAARYVILSSKPVQLVHLYVHDGWDSPWARKVTKKDLVQDVKAREALKELFGRGR